MDKLACFFRWIKKMIKIESYIKVQNELINIREFSGSLPNAAYPEGAILLILGGNTLISKDMWDYVDQLWFYLIDGVEHLLQRKHYMGYFPGQPIEIIFKDMNDVFAEVRVGDQHVVVEKASLFKEIVNAARNFFQFYLPLSDHPESEASVIQRLDNIAKVVPLNYG
ncbi:hypothetical protein P886_2386 [Alteromonadaceae bacterium 2753L.S.0a.02]|nr:hypothetical protein P886_2386 [Alteromonadaceae bacterium 2753L.S.0a.02]